MSASPCRGVNYVVPNNPTGSMDSNEESVYFSKEIGLEINYEQTIDAMAYIDSLDTVLSSSRTNYVAIRLSPELDEIFCSSIDTILHILSTYQVVIVQLEIQFCRVGAQYNALLSLFDILQQVPCRSIIASNQLLKKLPELLDVLFISLKYNVISRFHDINIASNRLIQSQTLSIINSITSGSNSQHICSLTLDNNVIDSNGARSLCDWIRRGDAVHLHSLSLRDCNLELNRTPAMASKTPIVMISNVLSTCPHAVRVLNLSNNIRNHKQLPVIIFQLLSRQDTIKTLYFNDNKLSSDDMESVAWFIECSKIQHLSLSHCYLGDEHISSLINALNGSRELAGLDISDNEIAEFAAIAEGLIRPAAHGKGLQYVNLSGNRPTYESFTQFSAWLTHSRSLRALLLDNCNIDCSMISVLCSRLMIYWLQQQKLPSSLSSSYGHGLSPPLHTISVQRNLIGHRGAQMMAVMMSKCPNHPLRVMNMASNHIGDIGISKLHSCLQEDRQLIHLDISKCNSNDPHLFAALEEAKFKLVNPPSHIMKAIHLCLCRTKVGVGGTADLIRYIISFLVIEIQRKIIV